MSEKLHDESLLRSRTREHAKKLYEKRWGLLTDADEQTLDVERWQASYVLGADVEKRAQRHFAAIKKALHEAVVFVASCRSTPRESDGHEPPLPEEGLPMGEAAQTLEQCVHVLLRTLDVIDQKRAVRLTINASERPERATWIRNRLDVYYRGEEALAKADRQELAVLGILGGWWPPKATGTGVRTRGMSIANVLAHEGDLMDRARRRITLQRREIDKGPFAKKLAAGLMAELLAYRNLAPTGAPVRSLQAHGVRSGHDDANDRPRDRARHRRTRGV